MKAKIEIKNQWTGTILFEFETEHNTIKQTLLEAVKGGANLRDADLRGANLRGADLRGANLRGANLRDADLGGANLRGADLRDADLGGADLRDADLRDADLGGADLRDANLRDADLRGANLGGADLRGYKEDLFVVLLYGRAEIQYLKENLIVGNIDGSCYEGSCSCLSGTLERGATVHNGPHEQIIKDMILKVRDAGRPIEKFFAAIHPGDTAETSQFVKLALEWIEEFEKLIA